MKRVDRVAHPISANAHEALAERTEAIREAKDRRAEAAKLWNSKPSVVFQEIREQLQRMAGGRSRCMYCEDSLGTDIEHFYPRTSYPRRTFEWSNYLLACSHCNSNLKRDEFPLDKRRPALIDPSKDDPRKHLMFLPESGAFDPIGPKGDPSIRVFGLNDRSPPRKLPQARKAVLQKLKSFILDYDEALRAGNQGRADEIREWILDEPFPVVAAWIMAIATSPAGDLVLGSEVSGVINHRGIAAWF